MFHVVLVMNLKFENEILASGPGLRNARKRTLGKLPRTP